MIILSLIRQKAWEMSAHTIVPESSGVVGAQKLAQHVHASLFTITVFGKEARAILDNTPGENGPEAWRRLVQLFGPPSS